MFKALELKFAIGDDIERQGSLYAAAKNRDLNRGTLWRVYYGLGDPEHDTSSSAEKMKVAKAYNLWVKRLRTEIRIPPDLDEKQQELFRLGIRAYVPILVEQIRGINE